jgi:zinc D-Ala-D-Ala dipeptidase
MLHAVRERPDEEARRTYWREQMNNACQFMSTVRGYPVEECGEPMVPLRDAVRSAHVTVAFSGTRINGKFNHLFYLREGLVENFLAVAKEMNRRRWVLKVEEAYRSRKIQAELMRDKRIFDVVLQRVLWERRGAVPSPGQMLRRVSALVANRPKVGTHMSGSALDISVVSREDDAEMDRGAPYVEMSELTPMASPFVSAQARKNRRAITALMARHGFVAYPYEFWHYSKGDAYDAHLARSGKPARYGAVDLDLDSGRTTPMKSPLKLLCAAEEVRRRIDEALKGRTA